MEEVEEENKSALWRREEQLKRWEMSETNSASSTARNPAAATVRFHDGCVFLAACSSGDRDEVTALLGRRPPTANDGGRPPTDVNTANVDGLTALHQACIDENLPMVKFLVEHGACITLCDNEGWTALHATASCGFVDIAKYLIEKGANLEAVNNDGDLALDLAEGKEMEKLISEAMEKQGIDAEQARKEEEEMMLRDAKQWFNSKAFGDVAHPKTGATALHIAAAKGYIKVMRILIDAGADVNATDFDGWTPLHAAAHWGQEEACKILVENFCDLDAVNNSGQTAFDVVDPDVETVLEELKKKQKELIEQQKHISSKTDDHIHGVLQGRRRSSITRMSVEQKATLPLKNAEEERAQMDALRPPAVEEKDEERKEEEEFEASKEATKSETEKRNEINTQTSRPLKQLNSSAHKISDLSSSEGKDKKVSAGEVSASLPRKELSVLPATLSRSQNITDDAKPETGGVLLRKGNSNFDRNQASLGNLSKETETKEKRVSEIVTKATGVVPPSVKTPVSRITSAPVTTSPASSASRLAPATRQDCGIETRSLVLTNRRIDEVPALWRSSLRKTGSARMVNSGHSSDHELDKIQRSVSVSRLASDRISKDPVVQKRLPVGSTEEASQKHRFNELYNRYAALVAPNSSSDQRLSRPTSIGAVSSSSSAAAAAGGISSASLSTQFLHGGTTSAPSARRLPGVARKDADTESGVGTGARSSSLLSQPKILEPTDAAANTQRRMPDVSKRDDEKEIERKARARKARETRRSTQGVSKEDLQRAEESLQAANAQRIVAEVAPERPAEPVDKLFSASTSSSTTTTATATVSSAAAVRSSVAEQQSEDSPVLYRRSFRDLDSISSTSLSSGYLPRTSRSSPLLSTGVVGASQPSFAVASVAPTLSETSSVTQASSSAAVPAPRTQYRSKYLPDKEAEGTKNAATTETADNKKEEKEDPSQKSAAIRARKKRDSRRSTGRIVLDGVQGPENQDDNREREEEKEGNSAVVSPSRTTPATISTSVTRPLVSSNTSTYTRYPYTTTTTTTDLDYKKMYEEECALNEKLKKEIKDTQKDLKDCRLELEQVKSSGGGGGSGSSLPVEAAVMERRMTFTEKRALERKISELGEDLKNSEIAKSELKADNQRLKDENGALIRVISKLSK